MSTKKATEMIRYYKNPNGPTIGVTAKDVIQSDGLYFKDLNGDGTLNTYKDWRKKMCIRDRCRSVYLPDKH